MNELFADSFYFIARLVREDQWHERAKAFAVARSTRLVTTPWILVEVADALSRPESRSEAGEMIGRLRHATNIMVVRASDDLFTAGLDLYLARPDKSWSLTDCISFVVVQARGLKDALTGDRHFEQAGFNALLKL